MAKVITPPAITDLNGLLELLVRPERGMEYLKQLQDMRDAILDGLGVVKTKNAADALLAQATDAMTEAQAQAAAIAAASQQQRQAVEQELGRKTQDLHTAQAQVAERLKQIIEREREVRLGQKRLDEIAAAQAATAQELAGRQIVLDGRTAHLEQEEAKLKQIKALMASHGV